ncbi:MAG: hypothetical protein EOP53_06530 [Sphingobacteriales bacterium]|nr:MAG: hypothetical protein EOP53_06530 [Sphingobacteriales bacterium]
MKKIVLLFLLFASANLFAQDTKYFLYKGTIDGNLPVTFFIKAEYNGCTVEAFYQGMYKYDKRNNWLQVYPTKNNKEQFVLVEYNFSGVLMMQKVAKNFTGIWISPDTRRQLKVELKEVFLQKNEKEELEKKLEELNYQNHDC